MIPVSMVMMNKDYFMAIVVLIIVVVVIVIPGETISRTSSSYCDTGGSGQNQLTNDIGLNCLHIT